MRRAAAAARPRGPLLLLLLLALLAGPAAAARALQRYDHSNLGARGRAREGREVTRPPDAAAAGPRTACDCRLGDVLRAGACAPVSDVADYYPPLAEAEGRAACPDWEARSEKLQRHLRSLQRSECTPERFAPSTLPRHGFGSSFMYAVYSLARGQLLGRAFDVIPGSLKLFAGGSCGAAFTCYLRPFSSCGEAGFRRWKKEGKLKFSEVKQAYAGAPVSKFLKPDERTPVDVPAEYADRGSLAWYHSELVAHLWQVNAEVRRAVEDVKRRIRYRHPIIAMHVRHGDACRDIYRTRRCYPLAEYMAHAQRMKDQYGVADIFLATDDPEVVQEAKAEYPGFRFVFAPVDRAWYGAPAAGSAEAREQETEEGQRQYEAGYVEKRLKYGEGDPAKVGLEAVIDTELMGQADFFIGTLGSNMDRLAFELILSRQRRVVPFASLDIGWCASYNSAGVGQLVTSAADGSKVRFDC